MSTLTVVETPAGWLVQTATYQLELFSGRPAPCSAVPTRWHGPS